MKQKQEADWSGAPEGHKGVAHDADGGRLMTDGGCPADVLCVGNVPQPLHGKGKHQTAVHSNKKQKCQVEAMISLQTPSTSKISFRTT